MLCAIAGLGKLDAAAIAPVAAAAVPASTFRLLVISFSLA